MKPNNNFYNDITKALAKGLPIDNIEEFAKDYDISQEKVIEFITLQARAKFVSSTFAASKKELTVIYGVLDKKFIEEHNNIVTYKREENLEFYKYSNGVYKHLDKLDMYFLVDALMLQYHLYEHRTSSRLVNDTINRIGSKLAGMEKRSFSDEFSSKKWYLNLKNGLLDPETFELKDHTPEYFSTSQAPFDFDPTKECPEFDKFLTTVSGEKDSTIAMIQEMYGYCLLNGNPMHKVFYLYGNTARNGKSTTAKILCGLLGWSNVSTLSLLQIAGENSSIFTSIVDKQLNFSEEISSKFVESSRLTALSSEGTIQINPKFKHTYTHQVKAKFIITCNDLPRFKDSQGMKHRMVSIPFPKQIKEEERIARLDERLLEKEGSGILNWALKGAKIIKKSNKFSVNEESLEDMKENLHQSNSTYAYLETKFDFSPDFTDVFDPMELYGVGATNEKPPTGFRLYRSVNGLQDFTSAFTFKSELRRFADETKKIKQIRTPNRNRMYTGLKLKSDVDDEKNMTF